MARKQLKMTSGGFTRGESGAALLGADFYHPEVGFGTVREADKSEAVRDLVVTFHDSELPPREAVRINNLYKDTFPASFESAVLQAIALADRPDWIIHT